MNDIQIAESYVIKANSAKEKGIPFDLTFNQYKHLLSKKKCEYSGIPLILEANKFNSLTFDRIDNSKGYTIKNIKVCARSINNWKSNLENPTYPVNMGNVIKITNNILNALETTKEGK